MGRAEHVLGARYIIIGIAPGCRVGEFAGQLPVSAFHVHFLLFVLFAVPDAVLEPLANGRFIGDGKGLDMRVLLAEHCLADRAVHTVENDLGEAIVDDIFHRKAILDTVVLPQLEGLGIREALDLETVRDKDGFLPGHGRSIAFLVLFARNADQQRQARQGRQNQ